MFAVTRGESSRLCRLSLRSAKSVCTDSSGPSNTQRDSNPHLPLTEQGTIHLCYARFPDHTGLVLRGRTPPWQCPESRLRGSVAGVGFEPTSSGL